MLLLATWCGTYAQAPDNYRYVKTWRIADQFGRADSIPVDTVSLNFQDFNYVDRYSIANSYNGNEGSPIQSKIYFDRPENSTFIFGNAYYPYLLQIETATFYNTKTPLSMLKYLKAGTQYHTQEDFGFLFTANANKRLNFGINIDYLYARGEYNQQAAKRFGAALFGSYNGERYSGTGYIASNTMSNLENGGIQSSDYITGSASMSTATHDIPINMEDGVQSNYKLMEVFYTQQYSIGFTKDIKVNADSVRKEFVPVTKFGHTIRFDDKRKSYVENTIEDNFYNTTYEPVLSNTDSVGMQVLTNRFSVSLAEEFNRLMKFGLTAYVENEVENFIYRERSLVPVVSEQVSRVDPGNRTVYTLGDVYQHRLQSNTKIGGVLSKELGQKFTYQLQGELTSIGYKAGDFLLKGNINSDFRVWKDTIQLQANGFIRSDEPSYFTEHYQSNHFSWNNNFDKTYRTRIAGRFAIPTRHFSVDVGIENVTKQIYYDTLALPAQHDGNIQILEVNLKKDFHVGKFVLENNIVYQASSNQDVIPLPDLTLYHNLYYRDKWFKDVLAVQIGADVRYNTAYYAPAYMPATGQFYSQKDMKIGNFPVMDVYANFHLKRVRFFVEYYHVNQLFMKDVYYSMPYYPINPAIIKWGLTWNFYN